MAIDRDFAVKDRAKTLRVLCPLRFTRNPDKARMVERLIAHRIAVKQGRSLWRDWVIRLDMRGGDQISREIPFDLARHLPHRRRRGALRDDARTRAPPVSVDPDSFETMTAVTARKALASAPRATFPTPLRIRSPCFRMDNR
jgi:hypothetical protein